MARYTGPSCRQCRREGTKLFLKGTKCFTEKCPVERRPYAPGQHGQATARRRKVSEYAKQLREKQKIKRIYGLSEKQFRNTFERVSTQQGITGHNLLAALEMHKSVEKEGREKAREILGGDVSDSQLDAMTTQNRSTNLYDTLRRVFTQMGRRDLAEKVVAGVDPSVFRGDIDF